MVVAAVTMAVVVTITVAAAAEQQTTKKQGGFLSVLLFSKFFSVFNICQKVYSAFMPSSVKSR